jgi:ferredoxin-NADP reductase
LTAIPNAAGRISWRVATLAGARWETASARTLALDVPGWPGHLAGQHVDVKLTAEDGYSAQRSYSIASPPGPGRAGPGSARLELTVQRLDDGEVSPYLTDVLQPGDQVELRGPIGGWFVWDPAATVPVQLIAGGSGLVPLMAMIRAAAPDASQAPRVPLRLLYSARTPADVLYREELAERALGSGLALTYAFTRAGPAPAAAAPGLPSAGPSAPVGGSGYFAGSVTCGRISVGLLAAATWGPQVTPAIFICGPSGFVEAASALLVAAGHDPATIKTELFGPTSLPGRIPNHFRA